MENNTNAAGAIHRSNIHHGVYNYEYQNYFSPQFFSNNY